MNYKFIIFITNLIIAVSVFALTGDEKSNAEAIGRIGFFNQDQNKQPQRNFDRLNSVEVAKVLGWVKDKNDCNFCGGSYFESSHVVNTPNPQAFRDAPLDVTAVKPAFFTKQGISVIQGDVVLRQPGREILADKATFFRDDKTGKFKNSVLDGNVKFREYGKLLVADHGDLDFVNKIYSLDHGLYRLLANTPTGLANVWGRAKHAVRNAVGVLRLRRATYSTCPPDATMWHLWSNNLTLNRDTGRGEAINTLLFLKNVPIFYTPYFNFPIDARRKSGFLIPTPVISKSSGYDLNVPYYFNLAPNYDAIFTPRFFSKRGVLFDGLFRYLTPTSDGSVDVNYIPYDRAFAEFRDTATLSDKANLEEFQALKKSSSGRGFLSLKNDSHFDELWRSSLRVNYATDDYFLRDFNVTPVGGGDRDQLLNRADIGYSSDRWNFLGRLQIFQTLHQTTEQETKNQYLRLPQLNLSGNFPASFGGLDYRFDSEVVNFMYLDSLIYAPAASGVSGVRFNLLPSVGAPLQWQGGNVTPKVQLQMTSYGIHDQAKEEYPNSIMRAYPLISVDSSSVFKRDISFFRQGYAQTFEPRLFYLFVPLRNQEDIPLFDTYLPAFDFDQLFRANRFSGSDRVGDAHQLALAVTTRFLDDYGQEKFNAGLGQIVVMRKHQVVIEDKEGKNLDPLVNENLSPLVGKLQYFINPKVNATFDMAWDPNYQRLNTANVALQYINGADQVVNLWYTYAKDRDQLLQGHSIDLSRIGSSFGWKVWQHWNIIGSLNYNTSYGRVQNCLYGVEYDSCCWAMRIASSRNFISIGTDNNSSSYDARIFFQLLFKGLGNSGDNGFGGALASQVKGFQDKFTQRV